MRTTTEWERKFPKFLIADSADERTFVIHLHPPRFVAEVIEHGVMGVPELTTEWIDSPSGLSAQDGAQLMREAGDFYSSEIDKE